jgi:hypothetical protein
MTHKEANSILKFMSRATLNGSEVPEFNDAVLAIHNSLEDHDDDGAYPDTEGEPSAVPWPA